MRPEVSAPRSTRSAALTCAAFFAVMFCLGSEFFRVSADEIRPLYRSARAQGMGGAYVGLADDESALFLNPAGLAGRTRSSFILINGDAEISSDVVSNYSSLAGSFKKFDNNSLNAVMGKNVFARGAYIPMLVMPNFGFAMIMDAQGGLFTTNVAMPQVTAGYQLTNGFQTGVGVSLISRKRPRPGQNDLRIGIAGKLLWRRGGYYLLSQSQLVQVSQGQTFLSGIVGNYKMGYGGDAGLQYVQPLSKTLTLTLASAFRDIGNTSFEGPASPIFSNLVVGGALKFRSGWLDINLAYDQSHLLTAPEWRRRNHLGLEIAIPVFSVFAGVNEVYVTYGGSVDLGFLKMTVASYGTETGYYAYTSEDRRYMLNMTLQLDF